MGLIFFYYSISVLVISRDNELLASGDLKGNIKVLYLKNINKQFDSIIRFGEFKQENA